MGKLLNNSDLLELTVLFIGVSFFIIEIWLVFMVSIYTEKAESHLPTSKIVTNNLSIWSHAGLIGKTMRNGQLTLALATPNFCSKIGLLEITEARQFPRQLKLILFTSWGLAYIFFAAMTMVASYISYFK